MFGQQQQAEVQRWVKGLQDVAAEVFQIWPAEKQQNTKQLSTQSRIE
jgi:hypothetical protein